MANVNYKALVDTTANIDAVKEAKLIAFDTTKGHLIIYLADGTTIKHVVCADTGNNIVNTLGNILMNQAKYIGVGSSYAQIYFPDTATVEINYGDLIVDTDFKIFAKIIEAGNTNGLTLREGTNQKGIHIENSTGYLGVNTDDPDVELTVNGSAHVVGDLNVDGGDIVCSDNTLYLRGETKTVIGSTETKQDLECDDLDANTSIRLSGKQSARIGLGVDEIVTNGVFASDTGWTKSGADVTISGGKAHLVPDVIGTLSQNIALVSGRTYKLVFTVTANSGTVGVDAAEIGITVGSLGTGTHEYTGVATQNSGVLAFVASGGCNIDIDNVSIKEFVDGSLVEVTPTHSRIEITNNLTDSSDANISLESGSLGEGVVISITHLTGNEYVAGILLISAGLGWTIELEPGYTAYFIKSSGGWSPIYCIPHLT